MLLLRKCVDFILHNYHDIYYTSANEVWGVYRNHPVCLSVCSSVHPSLQSKLKLDHNFWTKSDSALILHKCIPCDKTFVLIPKFLTLWPWPWLLTYFKKKLNLGHNCWTKRDRAFILHMCISCGKPFLSIPKSICYDIGRFWPGVQLSISLAQ